MTTLTLGAIHGLLRRRATSTSTRSSYKSDPGRDRPDRQPGRSGDLQLVDRSAIDRRGRGAPGRTRHSCTQKVTSNAYTALTVNVANANGLAGAPGTVDSPLADPKLREAFDLVPRPRADQPRSSTAASSRSAVGRSRPPTRSTTRSPCPARDLGWRQAVSISQIPACPTPIAGRATGRPTRRSTCDWAELVQAAGGRGRHSRSRSSRSKASRLPPTTRPPARSRVHAHPVVGPRRSRRRTSTASTTRPAPTTSAEGRRPGPRRAPRPGPGRKPDSGSAQRRSTSRSSKWCVHDGT